MYFTQLLLAAFSREPKRTASILPELIVNRFNLPHCSVPPTPAIKSFLNFNEIFT